MRASQLPHDLFNQVLHAARPQILRLWEEGDKFVDKRGLNCPQEIADDPSVGPSYFQCQPHFWECYWQGGVVSEPRLEVNLFGQAYHVRARPAFSPVKFYSEQSRHLEFWHAGETAASLRYGYLVELEIEEFPGLARRVLLADTCRDAYLPQRIYGLGSAPKDPRREGFTWDNFDRHIYIDKFYVSNAELNTWLIATGKTAGLIEDRRRWPHPALLDAPEQRALCAFFGKRVLEAKLFDAATMPPSDLANPLPSLVQRSQTPWHRDVSRTFLGMARQNPDFQLTPLDCQLAEVKGCLETHFTSDSATWMGIYHPLGYSAEAFHNGVDPEQNLKRSARDLAADSPWHELGLRTYWDGKQDPKLPVAFRCYEEVSP